jgi:alanyl-tRNA synthetase
MTDRLYYLDTDVLSFDATVIAVEGEGMRVQLDRTAFYPTSGGQPHDTGTLGGARVVDVVDEESRIVHVLDRPLAGALAQVHGQVDILRRRDHTQQHTAQHLLSAILHDQFKRPTVSFHLGAEVCTIDLDGLPLGPTQFADVETRVFDAIVADLPVAIAMHDDVTGLRLRKPTDRTGPIRVVTIEGVDVNACGGTHVVSTGQLGMVILLGVEKVKQQTRLSFVAGYRALAHVRKGEARTAELAAAFGAALDELVPLAIKQRGLVQAADKTVRVLTTELAKREGQDAYAAAVPNAKGRRVLRLDLAESIDDRTRAMVQAFVAGGPAVALVTSSAGNTVLLAASADSGVDAGAVLKPLLQRAGGKGGGSGAQAQGSVPDGAALATIRTEAVAMLER